MGLMERVVEHVRNAERLEPTGDVEGRDLALVELMVLAMHADRHEDAVEDQTVRDFCAARAWDPPLDAEIAFQRATDAVAEATARPNGVEDLFESICVRLGDAHAQQFALTEVAETMLADGRIDVGEMDFVDRLRERFGIHRDG